MSVNSLWFKITDNDNDLACMYFDSQFNFWMINFPAKALTFVCQSSAMILNQNSYSLLNDLIQNGSIDLIFDRTAIEIAIREPNIDCLLNISSLQSTTFELLSLRIDQFSCSIGITDGELKFYTTIYEEIANEYLCQIENVSIDGVALKEALEYWHSIKMLDAREENGKIILSLKDPGSPVQFLQQFDQRIQYELETVEEESTNQIQILPQIEKRSTDMIFNHLTNNPGRFTIESNGRQIIKNANKQIIRIENPDIKFSFKSVDILDQEYKAKEQIVKHRYEIEEKGDIESHNRTYDLQKIERENAINIKNAENKAEIEFMKNKYLHEQRMLELRHKRDIKLKKHQLVVYQNKLENEYERETSNAKRDYELQKNLYMNDESKLREKNMIAEKNMISNLNNVKLSSQKNIANYKLAETQEINRTSVNITKLKQDHELRLIQEKNQREIDNTKSKWHILPKNCSMF